MMKGKQTIRQVNNQSRAVFSIDGSYLELYQHRRHHALQKQEDCQYAHCQPVDSACVTKQDMTRRCECVNDYIEFQTICVPAPNNITVLADISLDSSSTNTTNFKFSVEFDGFGEIPPQFFNTTANQIPNNSILKLEHLPSFNGVHLKILNRPLSTTSFAIYLTATYKYRPVTIHQVIPVTIHVDDVPDPQTINIFVTVGTRQDTVVADVRGLGFLAGVSGVTYQLLAVESHNASPFSIREENGQIFCSRDINLVNLIAQELTFNVTAKIGHERPIIIAYYNILIIEDTVDVAVEENNVELFAMYALSSNTELEVSAEDLPTDIVHDSVNGTFLLSQHRDYEDIHTRTDSWTLTIDTRDGSCSVSIPMTLSIVDVNDERPRFQPQDYYFEILAGSMAGSVVGVITCVDPDVVDHLEYSVEPPFNSTVFSINEHGVITALVDLEKERFGKSITLSVSASDGKYFSKVPATITVDLITLYPKTNGFNNTYKVTIQEMMPPNTTVVNIARAYYTDFRFQGSKGGKYFHLNNKTGEIVTAVELDRETHTPLPFNIFARKETGDQCTTETIGRLVYSLGDTNDNSPNLTHSILYGSIRENSPPGTNVSDVMIYVTDNDIGANADVTVFLENSTIFATLKISFSQYMIKLKTNSLDREKENITCIKLIARDNPVDPRDARSTTVLVNITFLDENDNDPVFSSHQKELHVLENNAPSNITIFSATDADSGINSELMYTLVGGNGQFALDTDTGQLRTLYPLDRELRAYYDLTVIVMDKGYPTRTNTASIRIVVDDENDNRPSFGSPYLFFKRPEVKSCDSTTIPIKASDLDELSNGAITYSVNSSQSYFTIESTTGVLQCVSPLDYEKTPKIVLTVFAHDGGSKPLTSNVTVEIEVQNINDMPPVFSPSSYRAKVRKGEWREGMIIIPFHVSDLDFGSNLKTYIHPLHPYSDIFKVSHGIIRALTDKKPDLKQYTFNIIAIDNGHPQQTASASVTIDIVDDGIIEQLIQFNDTDFKFSIEENRNCTGDIGRLLANVREGVVANYSFTEDQHELFVLDEVTGGIRCTRALDREAKNRHIMTVRAYDAADVGMGDIAVVTVEVLDKNDNTPVFTVGEERLLFQIPEDVPVGYTVAAIRAVDADTRNNSILSYFISYQEYGLFDINSMTGDLITSQMLDRESLDTHIITVGVRDYGEVPLSASTTVRVFLTDVNDNPPSFLNATITLDVTEHTAVGTKLARVMAIDPDFHDNGAVAYLPDVLNSSNHSRTCPFKIQEQSDIHGPIGNIIVSSVLDFEVTPEYSCVIRAIDMPNCRVSCDERLTSTATLKVFVVDYNDNRPVFHELPYSANISRDLDIGTTVAMVRATDADTDFNNNHFTYTIVSGKILYQKSTYVAPGGDSNFAIHNSTGTVFLKRPLTSLDGDVVELTVIARDWPDTDPPLTSTATVTVTIYDDNPRPYFPKALTLTLTEEAPQKVNIINVTAQDRKGESDIPCNCTYSLPESEYSHLFQIDETTSSVSQISRVNREETSSWFQLTVKAMDDGTPPKSTFSKVTIIVLDINDNRPYFDNTRQNFNINQTAGVGSVIGHLSVVDRDGDVHSQSVFNSADIDHRLHLHQNGTIVVHQSLVNSQEETYDIKFSVVVHDALPLEFSDDINIVRSNLVVVTISVLYYNRNIHAPTFNTTEYSTVLGFNSRKHSVIDVNVQAGDLDGDDLSYHIVAGNTRDIITIRAESGKMTLSYDLDDTIASPINLTIVAIDDAPYPKTATCLVVIVIKNSEATRCIARSEYVQLGEKSNQRTTFIILFAAMTVLLATASVALIVVCYKWQLLKRTTLEKQRTGKKYENKDVIPSYDFTTIGSSSDDQHYYKGHEAKDFSGGMINPAYVSTGPRPECRPPPAQEPGYTGDRSSAPPEPEPDYNSPQPDDVELRPYTPPKR